MLETLPIHQQDAINAALFAGKVFDAARIYSAALNVSFNKAIKAVQRRATELRDEFPEKFNLKDVKGFALVLGRMLETLPPSRLDAMKAAIFSGRKSAAVQICRAALNVSPGEAANVIEVWAADLHSKFPEKFVSLESNRRPARIDKDRESRVAESGNSTGRLDLRPADKTVETTSGQNTYRVIQQPEVQRLNWRLLGTATGEVTLEGIMRYLAGVRSCPRGLGIDTSRISFVLDQHPDRIFIGLDEFDGYLAFIFEASGKTIMENPREGNAIYIFENDWKELSKLSKTEIARSRCNYKRIVHTGKWQERLLRCLR